ncbi:hypothetical protein OV079_01475 [Nannocystis pusilla]|uniref:Uncharacterized protein n=1 Tax=Nannocystis pusilla TaxID=889268 RepID=A0A9X3IVA8_9BACT|nr:hypothetical protein [Nannocystis pusilla]MCY1004259.1 hypothetical protein [Nannocystis pusilla]
MRRRSERQCDPDAGGADCLGICMQPPIAHCGGPDGSECAAGQVCIDDPNDDCDPASGGEDCIGVCEDLEILAQALE